MYDDIDLAQPVDFDDLELPDPEDDDEDVSEEPTAFASTEEILAAVANRVEANLSIGEVDLATAEELGDNTEPTLAHQPVSQPAVAPAPPVAVQPASAPAAGSNLGGLLLVILLASAAIAAAAFLAMAT